MSSHLGVPLAVLLVTVAVDSVSFAQIQWVTTVDGESWTPGMQVEVETFDTIQVVDTFTNNSGGVLPVELTQDFNPSEVGYIDSFATSGIVTQTSGHVAWSVTIPAGGSATLTLWVSALPCSWQQSPLQRTWLGTGANRDVEVLKWLGDLELETSYDPMVFSGQQASFTLQFGNTGGYENSVQVWCEFPAEATFASASPPADITDPAGLNAGWLAGDLANGDIGQIVVTVEVVPDLPIPTPLALHCAILDHTGVVADEVTVELVTAARVLWERTVNGELWYPGMAVEGETGDTIEVVEQLDNRSSATAAVDLTQHFESAHMTLVDSYATAGVVTPSPGSVEWNVEVGLGASESLVTYLFFDPCTWTESNIAAFLSEGEQWAQLAVLKVPPILWLDPQFDPEVVSGQPASFEIEFGNAGGYENDVEVWCDFPAEATYLSSSPPADYVDPTGLGAGWQLGDLARDESGAILVTVEIVGSLPPDTPIQIECDLLDHTDTAVAFASIDLVTVDASAIFADGFETGDTSAWSVTVP